MPYLHNPGLIFENIARVKRLADSLKYTGPITVAGDCTKLRLRLAYSTDFGSHILGTTMDLSQCEIEEAQDIDEIIEE